MRNNAPSKCRDCVGFARKPMRARWSALARVLWAVPSAMRRTNHVTAD